MLKKLKKFYPEEEIIDGFSILCFESYSKLEKFSSSFNKSLQRMILNEIKQPKSNTIVNSKLSQSTLISEIKTKINATPVSPTRITAQRKSKPDMNTLTLAICCNKRRNPSLSPIKHSETKIQFIEDDSKCADKENEDINKNKNLIGVVIASCPEKVCDIPNKSAQSKNDFYAMSGKEDSVNATSTLSPVSLQPVNCLKGDIESMDLDAPAKADPDLKRDHFDLVSNNPIAKFATESSKKADIERVVFTNSSFEEKISASRSSMKIEEPSQLADNDDHDCIITSIGFDPAPKLASITLSSVEHLLSDIPKLKAAPPFIPQPSIKTILFKNIHKSPRPPPLIPAPSYYFLSNLMVCRTSNVALSSKSKCISHKSVTSQKLKSPKRSLMKSSILKSSSKNVKLSSVRASKNPISQSNSTENTSNPIVRSILQSTHFSNAKLFSVNTPKNTHFSAMSLVNDNRFLFNNRGPGNRTAARQSVTPKISGINDKKRKSGIINKVNNLKHLVISKTRNHVDIANFIFQHMKTKGKTDRNNLVSLSIIKPKVLKPHYPCPYIPISQFTQINGNLHPAANPESINLPSCQLNKTQSLYRYNNKPFSINSNLRLQNDPQALSHHPLNSINSTFGPNSTVFLNSTGPNSVNFCPRPNLLVLQ